MSIPVQDAVDGLRTGGFHWRLLAIVGAIILLDGFDIQLAAFAGPAILADWKLEPSALAPAMAAALVGMAIGTGVGGALGDRIGRRPALIASVVWFGVVAMLTALAEDVAQFAALRFITGLGLGAAVPNATALVAEWMPPKLRNYAVTLVIVAVPCGGMIGAGLASWLIPTFGWHAAFALGGALPLLLALVMLAGLPESPIFLARKQGTNDRIARMLAKAGGQQAGPFAAPEIEAGGGRVYSGPLARSAIGLAVAFFASMLALYACLSWIPVLLSRAGFAMDSAIRGAMIFNLCGVLASFVAAWATPRLGSRRTLICAAAIALLATIGWAWLIAAPDMPHGWILAGVGATGAGVLALQVMLYGLAAHVFPVECRAAGIGYSASIGRLGAISSAFGAGIVLGLPGGAGLFFGMIGVAIVGTALGVILVDRHVPASREIAPNDNEMVGRNA
ncbi:MFS transporter [Sphingomonas cavernae]|uniref:MFS transporter n=1 Tax=Sphingomonas cavernae TaxID=2320861 RepID=A0A418WUV3_9SPHN|nr:MFS transporter [Sphingomonas cavernae]RJF96406.1 MFS transporter [Sphingomonas cavernae]